MVTGLKPVKTDWYPVTFLPLRHDDYRDEYELN